MIIRATDHQGDYHEDFEVKEGEEYEVRVDVGDDYLLSVTNDMLIISTPYKPHLRTNSYILVVEA